MSKLWILVFLAACAGKSAPVTNDPSTPVRSDDPGSAAPAGGHDGPICGTRGAAECAEGTFCHHAPGAQCGMADAPGHCMKPPEACAEIYKPVCGCDGKTYGNECAAAAARTGVMSEGECPAAATN